MKHRRTVSKRQVPARRYVGTLEPTPWRVIFWPLAFFWPRPKMREL